MTDQTGTMCLPRPIVGMIGAGQLARMTYQAGISLGLTVRVLATASDESAALIAAAVDLGSPTALESLASFARTCDVLTFDHELVAADHLAHLESDGHTVHPSARVVALVQDKGRQRLSLAEHGFPGPDFAVDVDGATVEAFGRRHGWPLVMKARRGGYDGRGVWVVRDAADARSVLKRADEAGTRMLVESYVPIERELAILVARRPSGDAVVYPLVETVQVAGICREVLAPAPVPARLQAAARDLALAIANRVGVVGVLAVELFLVGDRLLVNELAARPHNSGHYSIEACLTSQFENHLRAVLDWPLGATDLVAPASATVNVLGSPQSVELIQSLPRALEVEGARIHLYGKTARSGRKLGHVTAIGPTPELVLDRARRAAERLGDVRAAVGRMQGG